MFTPLDSDLVYSTVFSEGPLVFAIWCALLATKDLDGLTALTPEFLAKQWNMDLAEIEKAWSVHTSPDLKSKNQEFEGKRIIPSGDGRWFVVSHLKYRSKYKPQARLDQLREAKRRQRERDAILEKHIEETGRRVVDERSGCQLNSQTEEQAEEAKP